MTAKKDRLEDLVRDAQRYLSSHDITFVDLEISRDELFDLLEVLYNGCQEGFTASCTLLYRITRMLTEKGPAA